MSAFELVLIVTIGDLVQQGVTQEDMSVTGAMLAVCTIALLVVATSYLGFRRAGWKRVIEGVPAIIVRDGQILDDVIAIERLSPDEVIDSAREQGIGRSRTCEIRGVGTRWQVLVRSARARETSDACERQP